MIAHLHGNVLSKRNQKLIVDIQGLGYKVTVPAQLFEKTETHLPIDLHIHTVVREDDISLYGFETEEALELFELLISVSGVGPKVGLDLFVWPITKIKSAIVSKDVTAITQIKGIGKKTAERIILELRSKLGSLDNDNLPEMEDDSTDSLNEEVLDALMGLGYQQRDIKRVFKSIKEPLSDPEKMIKYFLKHV